MKNERPAVKAPFDLETVYYEQIFPLMAKIAGICKTHKLPMLASFNFAHGRGEDPGEDEMCTTFLGHGELAPPELVEAVHIITHGSHSRCQAVAVMIHLQNADEKQN